jgi:diaminopimelate decarboxylase
MTGFDYKDGVMHVDDIALSQIAEDFGTPAYVYSASVIRAQHNALKSALKRHLPADRQPLLCYACKANTNIAILRLLKNLGTGLEIVSEGELAKGIKAGFKGEEIISTSFGKNPEEIRACLAAGIAQFNIESFTELEQLNETAGEMGKIAPVLFRLNPNIDSGGGHAKISTGGKRDKFGMSAPTIMEAYKRADELPNLEPIGLSVHIGSQVAQVEKFEPAYKKLAEMTLALREAGYTVSRLDIGGGFPIVYNDEKLLDLDAYAKWVNDIIVPLDTEIQMEPGRYLVGNAGVLLSKVLYVKETQDQDFLVLDAAMNDLIRPTLYEAYHGIRPVQNPDAPIKSYDVVGPICESGDTFTKGRELPEMKMGDLTVIETTGAYGAVMASNYNTRPFLPEILVDGDKVAVIRGRQSIEDIIAAESIPDWL